MIKRQFLNSGDGVSFLWPTHQNAHRSAEYTIAEHTIWEAIHGIIERVFPNGDFVVVDEKGLSPQRFAYAAMGKAKRFSQRVGKTNPMHRYTMEELWEGDK